MKYILIIEDHIVQRRRLVQIINGLNEDIAVLEAESEEQAIKLAEQYPISLFYIDVQLKSGSGIGFAEKIRTNTQYELTWIVFITGYKQYMLHAFKRVHCYDYILKPYKEEEVRKITLKLLNNCTSKKKDTAFLTFDIEDILVRIYLKDIYFIEVIGKNCVIHTVHGKHEIKRFSLRKMLEITENTRLYQSHRAYLINVDKICKVEYHTGAWSVFFEGYQSSALVGITYQSQIKKVLLQKPEEKTCI